MWRSLFRFQILINGKNDVSLQQINAAKIRFISFRAALFRCKDTVHFVLGSDILPQRYGSFPFGQDETRAACTINDGMLALM